MSGYLWTHAANPSFTQFDKNFFHSVWREKVSKINQLSKYKKYLSKYDYYNLYQCNFDVYVRVVRSELMLQR